MFIIQYNVVGKENYLFSLCSEKHVKICHNNQNGFMMSNGGPRKAGSGKAVEKEINGYIFKGIISIGYIKLNHYGSVHIKKESRELNR